MDVNREIRSAVTTGKTCFGIRETKKVIKDKKAKMVIIASNCPEIKNFKTQYPKLPIFYFKGTGFDLGAACGKPFSISILTIIDPGESNVLTLSKKR